MHIDLFARVVLGMVFLLAAAGKLSSTTARRAFTSALVAVGVHRAPVTTSVVVVVAEFAAATLLAVPRTVIAGYLLSIALLVVFLAGIIRVVRSGRTVACHCFGNDAGALGVRHLVRNAVLIMVGAVGLVGHPVDARLSPGQTSMIAGAGVLTALLVLRWEDLAYLLSTSRTRR